ncbi:hypothetical protein POTOM_042566 [Populus tomentosa]|uniref:Uncharacterized protein n=1 Tax=Populus tomentosa TaxID=118781 RepID=A0A8X7Z0J8_POPTO|nr:hypothetical protein POTOM_042566 [Populus tomentosa]
MNATSEKKIHVNNGKDNKSKVLRAYHATKPAFFEEVVVHLGFLNEDDLLGVSALVLFHLEGLSKGGKEMEESAQVAVSEEFKVENYLARVRVEIGSMVFIFLVEVFANFKPLDLRFVTVTALGSYRCKRLGFDAYLAVFPFL